jgi:hypothetical protein
MKFHSVAAATLALAVSFSGAAFAAPATSIHAPVHAFFGKSHIVKVTLHNDGQQPLTLKSGDQEWTLQPGKEASVKLTEGDKVIAETASPDHAAGDVVLQAISTLDGATVRIK